MLLISVISQGISDFAHFQPQVIRVIALQEHVAYQTCCSIAHAVLTHDIRGPLAAPAMTWATEHTLTILGTYSYKGIMTFKYLKHSIHFTAALHFHGV